jgi:hypothetical protein
MQDMLASLTIEAIDAENLHLTMPAELADALGHTVGRPRIATPDDIVETLADPTRARWHSWARDRALDVLGVAVQITAAEMRERRRG